MGPLLAIGRAFALLAVVWALLAVLATIGSGLVTLDGWLEEGYVRVEARSEQLQLTGTPGDRIKLQLPLPADAHADYRETAVRIGDAEVGVETVVPLAVELDDDSEPKRVFAWLLVPDLPGGERRTLKGTLSGRATRGKATIGSYDVALTLQVGPRGTIATSGVKDMTWQNRVAVLIAIVIAGAGVGIGAGIVTTRSRARANGVSERDGQSEPEARPLTGSAHPAQEGNPT